MPHDTPLLMTPPVYQSILEWSLLTDRPLWQKDCLRRIIQGLVIDSAVLDELEEICTGTTTHTAVPLSKAHLPSYFASGESVTLLSLAELSNVNRLPSDGITFGKGPGLSIVYGENGSGKSGYARVIKKACHTRGSKPDITGNVYAAPTTAKPAAKIHYAVKDTPACCSWLDGNTADAILSSVFVFDSESAKHYLNENGPTCFTPLGLHVLVALANVADKLHGRLQDKVNELEQKNILVSKGWKYPADTAVAKLLLNLSHSTSTADIEKLAVFGDDKAAQLLSLTQALSEDPLAKSRATTAAAKRIRDFLKVMQDRTVALSDAKLEELQQSLLMLHAKEELRRMAHPVAFDASFLKGTGNVEWQRLWQAAKKFAVDFAYQDQSYPSAIDQACVLCQRPLDDPTIVERMQRFDAFVLNQAATQYQAALESWKNHSSSFNVLTPIGSSLQTVEADFSGLAHETKNELTAFIKSADTRLQEVKALIKSEQWAAPIPCLPSPTAGLEQFITTLDQRAELEASLVMPDEVAKRKAEKAELEANAWLKQHKDQVVEQVERLKKIQTLKTVMKSTNTQAISKKNGEIANEAITDTFIRSFETEATALHIKTIPTKIEKIGTRKGELEYGIKLQSTIRTALKEVASEGEQRAIALAAFFAELQIAPHKSTLVIDDPVSSLDYHRRKHVAKRLIQEAKQRQVIVFTHDAMFLMEMIAQAEGDDVAIEGRYLHWGKGQPGHCSHELPIETQKYSKRINDLKEQCKRMAKTWNPQPNPDDVRKIREFYGVLRSIIEQIVHDVIICGVVKRLQLWVNVGKLSELKSVTSSEVNLLKSKHGKASNLIDDHVRELAEVPGVPDPAELLQDIDAIEKATDEINRRKHQPQPMSATASA